MNETRSRVERAVTDHPGVHFNDLTRRLDIAPGQTQYHLRRLREAGRLVDEPLYGRTHYYPPEYDRWARGALALARRETARDVLLYLVEHGASPPARVAEGVGIARSTLEYHVDRLAEQDLVAKRRPEGNRVLLTLTRPERTLELLDAIRPSLPDRFLDRFTRLVDSLLAGERE